MLADFRSGRVPAIIVSMNMPSNLPWLKDAMVDNYRRCSHIGIEGPGHAVEVWVHRSRTVEDRTVTVQADVDVS